ncbi:MAG: hypothetical protein HPY83_18805 [Anaerolineae bacterium]|nr:hypothetical protein [Anaerolineae bacterium]
MRWQLKLAGADDEPERELTRALEAAGLVVYRSFSLCEALQVLPQRGCPCKGTPDCTRRYTILLVYHLASPPALMIVHQHKRALEVQVRGHPAAALEMALADALFDLGARPAASGGPGETDADGMLKSAQTG